MVGLAREKAFRPLRRPNGFESLRRLQKPYSLGSRRFAAEQLPTEVQQRDKRRIGTRTAPLARPRHSDIVVDRVIDFVDQIKPNDAILMALLIPATGVTIQKAGCHDDELRSIQFATLRDVEAIRLTWHRFDAFAADLPAISQRLAAQPLQRASPPTLSINPGVAYPHGAG